MTISCSNLTQLARLSPLGRNTSGEEMFKRTLVYDSCSYSGAYTEVFYGSQLIYSREMHLLNLRLGKETIFRKVPQGTDIPRKIKRLNN